MEDHIFVDHWNWAILKMACQQLQTVFLVAELCCWIFWIICFRHESLRIVRVVSQVSFHFWAPFSHPGPIIRNCVQNKQTSTLLCRSGLCGRVRRRKSKVKSLQFVSSPKKWRETSCFLQDVFYKQKGILKTPVASIPKTVDLAFPSLTRGPGKAGKLHGTEASETRRLSAWESKSSLEVVSCTQRKNPDQRFGWDAIFGVEISSRKKRDLLFSWPCLKKNSWEYESPSSGATNLAFSCWFIIDPCLF